MCVNRFNIRPAHFTASSLVFVPCGKCEECRDFQRMQWQFRFRCELEFCRKNGYNIGFFTLTYKENTLPTIPPCLFKDENDFSVIPCFSRTDVRTFIDNIRKRCHEKYKDVVKLRPLRYGVFSEYGESTQRPHYHGLIAFPSEISAEYMFDLIRRNWQDKGFVFPKDINGGVDSHGYKHKPFLIVGDVEGAANYAAKYACKDIAFYDFIRDKELKTRHPLFKKVVPFHCQSRGIGRSFLVNKSSAELARLLADGESFVGQTKTKKLPLYIRNKILFKPYYVFDKFNGYGVDDRPNDWIWSDAKQKFVYARGHGTHVRLVRKEGTSFFWSHYREIYEQKKEYYVELFTQMCSSLFWQNRYKDDLKKYARITSERFSSLVHNVDSFTDYYLAYHGVHPQSIMNSDPASQWCSRYMVFPVGLNEVEPWSMVDSQFFDDYAIACDTVVTALKYCSSTDDTKRAELRRILDFYKHQT